MAFITVNLENIGEVLKYHAILDERKKEIYQKGLHDMKVCKEITEVEGIVTKPTIVYYTLLADNGDQGAIKAMRLYLTEIWCSEVD